MPQVGDKEEDEADVALAFYGLACSQEVFKSSQKRACVPEPLVFSWLEHSGWDCTSQWTVCHGFLPHEAGSMFGMWRKWLAALEGVWHIQRVSEMHKAAPLRPACAHHSPGNLEKCRCWFNRVGAPRRDG